MRKQIKTFEQFNISLAGGWDEHLALNLVRAIGNAYYQTLVGWHGAEKHFAQGMETLKTITTQEKLSQLVEESNSFAITMQRWLDMNYSLTSSNPYINEKGIFLLIQQGLDHIEAEQW